MSRPLTIRQPRRSEVRRLDDFLVADGLTSSQRRRAEAIALYAAGLTAVDIAAALQAHANTIYADWHAFDQAGLAAIHQIGRRGAACRITPAQRQRILQIAEQTALRIGPALWRLVLGQPPGLSHPAAHPQKRQPRASTPDPKKRGFVFRRVQRKRSRPDPQRQAILARIRYLWRHRPRQGLLLFFDVKVIPVKAYGGRRYTREKTARPAAGAKDERHILSERPPKLGSL